MSAIAKGASGGFAADSELRDVVAGRGERIEQDRAGCAPAPNADVPENRALESALGRLCFDEWRLEQQAVALADQERALSEQRREFASVATRTAADAQRIAALESELVRSRAELVTLGDRSAQAAELCSELEQRLAASQRRLADAELELERERSGRRELRAALERSRERTLGLERGRERFFARLVQWQSDSGLGGGQQVDLAQFIAELRAEIGSLSEENQALQRRVEGMGAQGGEVRSVPGTRGAAPALNPLAQVASAAGPWTRGASAAGPLTHGSSAPSAPNHIASAPSASLRGASAPSARAGAEPGERFLADARSEPHSATSDRQRLDLGSALGAEWQPPVPRGSASAGDLARSGRSPELASRSAAGADWSAALAEPPRDPAPRSSEREPEPARAPSAAGAVPLERREIEAALLSGFSAEPKRRYARRLLNELFDGGRVLRERAAQGLVDLVGRSAAPALIAALRRVDDAEGRAALLAQIGAAGHRGALPVVESYRRTSDALLRASALEVSLRLQRDEPRAVLELLRAGLEDADPRVRRRTVVAVSGCPGIAHRDVLLPLLRDADPQIRRVACAALSGEGDAVTTRALLGVLLDDDASVRQTAAGLLEPRLGRSLRAIASWPELDRRRAVSTLRKRLLRESRSRPAGGAGSDRPEWLTTGQSRREQLRPAPVRRSHRDLRTGGASGPAAKEAPWNA